jgi:hypothetical protein
MNGAVGSTAVLGGEFLKLATGCTTARRVWQGFYIEKSICTTYNLRSNLSCSVALCHTLFYRNNTASTTKLST